jgi:hypothetical protein
VQVLKTEKFAAEKAHTEALSVQEVIKAEKLWRSRLSRSRDGD